MSERQLVVTEDGSHSFFVPSLDEHYHSHHGAIQESNHVFIEKGLKRVSDGKDFVRILEVGFGTGLNALLTALEAVGRGLEVEYWTLEAFPLTKEELAALNYAELMPGARAAEIWGALHLAAWGEMVSLCPEFRIHKMNVKVQEAILPVCFDLIYFDAFAPEKQPELWTGSIFEKMWDLTSENGILTTYCAKGSVRRSMVAAGFKVERTNGPPGKREMLIAMKD